MLAKLARRKGWLQDNPASEIELLKVPEERKKPHIPWTDAAVETWRSEASDLPMLIFELGVGSVQRPEDLSSFIWDDYDGDNLKLTQNKTGVKLQFPCTPNLKSQLDRLKVSLGEEPKPDRPILANDDGSAMKYHKIARVMRAERERLAVLEHDLHALRYRGVMELAWAGCDDDEIMSYSGHKTKKMVVKYAGFARQVMRAESARNKGLAGFWRRFLGNSDIVAKTRNAIHCGLIKRPEELDLIIYIAVGFSDFSSLKENTKPMLWPQYA